MADSRRVSVVDGFSTLKALRLGLEERGVSADQQAANARIMRTALPSRHEIVCYRCKHTFDIRGRLRSTQCPKCRVSLKKVDYKVDGEWNKNVETIGTIHITRDGVLKGGCELVGRDIVLEGAIEEGKIWACRRLLLGRGAKFKISDLKALDFVVADGAKVSFLRRKVQCRNVEVKGELRAKIYAAGHVVVRAGGVLKGEIHASHLVVEEGGGLIAKVFVRTE